MQRKRKLVVGRKSHLNVLKMVAKATNQEVIIYVTLREVLCDLREQALFFHTLKYGKKRAWSLVWLLHVDAFWYCEFYLCSLHQLF